MSDKKLSCLQQYNWEAGKSYPGRRFALYPDHYACFACRKMFKKPQEKETVNLHPLSGCQNKAPVPCPQCGKPMANMGKGFRPPKRRDVKGWQEVEKQVKAGRRFWFIPSWL